MFLESDRFLTATDVFPKIGVFLLFETGAGAPAVVESSQMSHAA
jgi:hypothetical protein